MAHEALEVPREFMFCPSTWYYYRTFIKRKVGRQFMLEGYSVAFLHPNNISTGHIRICNMNVARVLCSTVFEDEASRILKMCTRLGAKRRAQEDDQEGNSCCCRNV